MTEGFIQVAPDGAGKKMETAVVESTIDGADTHREVVVLGDKDGGLQTVADVVSALADTNELLLNMLNEMTEIKLLLLKG